MKTIEELQQIAQKHLGAICVETSSPAESFIVVEYIKWGFHRLEDMQFCKK
jgi:hypothetical protein